MNSQFHRKHPSYQKHRRQFWLQIFLPMILAVVLILAVAVWTGMAAFGEAGDAARWAAVSTIWLVFPLMFFGLIFLLVLVGLVYLLAQALRGLPTYSSKAQYYVNLGANKAKHFSDLATRPVLFVGGITASLKAFFNRD